MSKDTTMRNRRKPRTNPEPHSEAHAFSEPDRAAAPIVRIFSPAELDLDDLAGAIRSLLGPSGPPQIRPRRRPTPDLLSPSRRVSHVVEANKAP